MRKKYVFKLLGSMALVFGMVLFSADAFGQYCSPALTGNWGNVLDISTTGATKLNMNNNTGAQNAAYTDYSNDQSKFIISAPGSSINITTTASWGYAIYIDWNQDNDFNDAGERLVSRSMTTSTNGGQDLYTLNIPGGQATGKYQMRWIAGSSSSTTTGYGNPCGGTATYEAEDYALIVAPPQPHDAGIRDLSVVGMDEYSLLPLSQAPPLVSFQAEVFNDGIDTISNTTMNIDVNNGAFTTTESAGTLQASDDSLLTTLSPYSMSVGAQEVVAYTTINETDTFNFNDTASLFFEISDTVMAYDDTNVVSGIGNGTVITFGQVYEVTNADTMTSVSLYLNNSPTGLLIGASIYEVSPTTGMPTTKLDSTRNFEINSSNNNGWLSLKIGCEGLVLQPGKYLVAIEQRNPLNMALGYTNRTARKGDTIMIMDFYDGQGWRNEFDASVNALLQGWTLKIRPNFGRIGGVEVLSDSLRFCNQGSGYVKAVNEFSSYQWTGNIFKDSLKVTSQGIYNVTATDQIGCVYYDSIEVVENPSYMLNVVSNSRATCGNADGMVAVSANSAFGPISYAWDNQLMGATVQNIAGGSYEVTATDAYGCEEMTTVQVLGIYPSSSTAFEYPTCSGDADGRATVMPSDTIGAVTYTWSGGNNVSSATTGGLSAGTYYVTVTDDNICPIVDSIVVTDPAVMSLDTIGSTNPTGCNSADGEATVNPTGGIAPYTYSWAGDPNAITKNFIYRKAGRYDVTVTDKNGCVKTTSVTLIEENAPMITITEDSVTCHYDEGTSRLSVSGGTAPYGFTWSNSNGVDSNITATPGTYSVNISDAAGCNQLRTVKVKGPEAVDITFNVIDNGECNMEAQAVIIGGNSPYSSVTWSNGQSGNTATGLCNKDSLTYWVFVEDAEGCVDSAEVAVKSRYTSVSSLAGLNSGFVMYPNPTQGNVTLTFDALKSSDNLSIRVFDMLGSTVSTLSGTGAVLSNNVSLDLSDQPSGVYMVEVSLNGTTTTKRLQVGK